MDHDILYLEEEHNGLYNLEVVVARVDPYQEVHVAHSRRNPCHEEVAEAEQEQEDIHDMAGLGVVYSLL